jgi:hypothetical protein
MLSASLITTAWRVLRLRMEETASRYGGCLRIYRTSSREQPTRGDPPALQRRKNKLVTKCHEEPRPWTVSLDKRPKLRRRDVRFRTWKVRSLCRAGLLVTVEKKISEYKLCLEGRQEVRWDRCRTEPAGEFTFS